MNPRHRPANGFANRNRAHRERTEPAPAKEKLTPVELAGQTLAAIVLVTLLAGAAWVCLWTIKQVINIF